MKIKFILFPILLLLLVMNAAAQSNDTLLNALMKLGPPPSKFDQLLDNLSLRSYGMLNYYNYDWQIWPDRPSNIDMERIVFEGEYKIKNKFSIFGELEFEHGGTGVTVEFDRFEEFGEFETDVEKGGEIWFEEFGLKYEHNKYLNFSAGRIRVPFALNNFRDEPTEFFTTNLPEMEATLLPTAWTEYGAQIKGQMQNWKYYLATVTSLDGSAFNSANFIRRGIQKRFEYSNAEDMAVAARIDYTMGNEQFIGASIYYGNSRNNRPKRDLKTDAYVTMFDLHAVYEFEPIEISALMIYGELQNSDKVTYANRNLSNNLNVKRTPVGASAMGYAIDVGLEVYDLLPLLGCKHPNGELVLFARIDSYDTMHQVAGEVADNPRWDRTTLTYGVNFQPIPEVIFKGQYALRTNQAASLNKENTLSFGIGYYIK